MPLPLGFAAIMGSVGTAVTTAGSRAAVFAASSFASAKAIYGILFAMAIMKLITVFVVGILAWRLLPIVLEEIPRLIVPGDLRTMWGPEVLYFVDLFALDVALQVVFTAYIARFLVRRFA